ncbi:MAG: hypothetical protein K0S32_669 [Bacteroidetes bacterium]|jgi:hypothetical protein|nr:hypothetical protein [Bacteroidota bacterium]
MKKIMTIIGMAGMLCLAPSCKKKDVKPLEPNNNINVQHAVNQKTAQMHVLLDSKPCSEPQNAYTSATLDIREIKVFNSEHGWEDLTTVPGAWDVVSLQSAPIPVADLTEHTAIHTGTITQVKLVFGSNNKLVVNDQAASCYGLSTKEVILEMHGEINANTFNEMVISIDICGNISVHQKYDEDPCYTLKPVMAFQSLTSTQIPQ